MKAETVTHALYNGTVELVWYPKSHRAKVGDAWLPSVTSITGLVDKSAFLLPWAANLCRDYMKQAAANVATPTHDWLEAVVEEAVRQYEVKKQAAASVGDIVHQFALDFAKAQIARTSLPVVPSDLPQEAVNGISAFVMWVTQHKVAFSAAERLVCDPERGYFGWADAIAVVDGVVTLIDYKTSRSVYPEHLAQVAGYWQAYNAEAVDAPVQQAYILHFDKETGAFDSSHELLVDSAFYEQTCLPLFNGLHSAKRQIDAIKQRIKHN